MKKGGYEALSQISENVLFWFWFATRKISFALCLVQVSK